MEQYQRETQKLPERSKFGDDFAASSLVPNQSKWSRQTKGASTSTSSHKKRKSHEASSSDDELLLKPETSVPNKNSRLGKATTRAPPTSRKVSSTPGTDEGPSKSSTLGQIKGKKQPKMSVPSQSTDTTSHKLMSSKQPVRSKTKSKKTETLAQAAREPSPSGSDRDQTFDGPRPFPMDLDSIGGPSCATRSVASRSSSVMSARSSVSAASRSRRSSSASGTDEGDITFTQYITRPKIDPEKLCPFCDEQLPEKPSSKLLRMLQKLRGTSEPDPRMGNKLGLKADMDDFTPFCSRHEAESREFPRGRRKGWPVELDVDDLTKRTLRLERKLQAIIDDPTKGTFLLPLRKADKNFGKGAVSGARAQWLNFENTSAGYYGEQGFSIIMHILLDLFPEISPSSMAPLNQSDYFAIVLVPEMALLLIQQDLQAKSKYTDDSVSRARALEVLRESRRYGEAMFPVEEDLDGNIADDVARRRATKIRRQNDEPKTRGQIVDLSDSDDDPEVRTPTKKSSETRAAASSQSSKSRQGSAESGERESGQKKKRTIKFQTQQEAFPSFVNGEETKKQISNAWLWTP